MIYQPRTCDCGSGEFGNPQFDARGIYLTRTCPRCHDSKMRKYRKDVLEDPHYECNEPIDPE